MASLSGGEAQRVRLATLLGNGLSGVIYILDEPSVGLHPRDTGQLLEMLKRLCHQGNTVVVVEHDPETMLAADHLIDLGPGCRRAGGAGVCRRNSAGRKKYPGLADRTLSFRRVADFHTDKTTRIETFSHSRAYAGT